MALYGKADARVVALTLERQGTREPGALLAGDALLPGSQNALALFAAMARSIVIAHCVAALGTDGSVHHQSWPNSIQPPGPPFISVPLMPVSSSSSLT